MQLSHPEESAELVLPNGTQLAHKVHEHAKGDVQGGQLCSNCLGMHTSFFV